MKTDQDVIHALERGQCAHSVTVGQKCGEIGTFTGLVAYPSHYPWGWRVQLVQLSRDELIIRGGCTEVSDFDKTAALESMAILIRHAEKRLSRSILSLEWETVIKRRRRLLDVDIPANVQRISNLRFEIERIKNL